MLPHGSVLAPQYSATRSLRFDGSLSIVKGEVNYAVILKHGFSVSLWFYVEGMGSAKGNTVRLASIGNEAFTIEYNCFGQVEVHAELKKRGLVAIDNNEVADSTTLPTRRWHFLVVSIANVDNGAHSRSRVYIDGRMHSDRLFDAPFQLQSENRPHDSSVRLGNNDESSKGFEGKMDDWSIWGKALTREECDELYHSRDGIPDYKADNLLTAWSFDISTSTNLDKDHSGRSQALQWPAATGVRGNDGTERKLRSDTGARMFQENKSIVPLPSRQIRDTAARRIQLGETRAREELD